MHFFCTIHRAMEQTIKLLIASRQYINLINTNKSNSKRKKSPNKKKTNQLTMFPGLRISL